MSKSANWYEEEVEEFRTRKSTMKEHEGNLYDDDNFREWIYHYPIVLVP